MVKKYSHESTRLIYGAHLKTTEVDCGMAKETSVGGTWSDEVGPRRSDLLGGAKPLRALKTNKKT